MRELVVMVVNDDGTLSLTQVETKQKRKRHHTLVLTKAELFDLVNQLDGQQG